MVGPLQGALALGCLLGSMLNFGCYEEYEMSLPSSATSGSTVYKRSTPFHNCSVAG